MPKICDHREDLAFPITLEQSGPDNFAVIYGKQRRERLTYSQACTEYGMALLHALACDGILDNSEA
jgi:hypothetical protein